MKFKKLLNIYIFFTFLPLLSCGSYVKKMQESERLFYIGKYKEASRKLLPAVNRSDKDQLLFQMECGTMLHAGGDYKNSNKVFLAAAKSADKITTSITKQVTSLFINDCETNYKGEDFERVLLHMYTGMNFLMLNDAENARVEFKKVNNQLQYINISNEKKYKQNIMAKYLTAIAFEISGDIENDENDLDYAYVEYKQIYKLAPQLKIVKYDLLRMSEKLNYQDDCKMWKQKFGIKNKIEPEMGELVVIYQAGQGAIKKSRGPLLRDRNLRAKIRVSFNNISIKQGVALGAIYTVLKNAENPIPRFVKRQNRIKSLIIEANGKFLSKTNLLENIEYTAIKNMQEQYSSMYAKVAAKIVTNTIAAIAAGAGVTKLAKMNKKTKGCAGLLGFFSGTAVAAGLISQMKPDLRCWHTLPANLQLSRIFFKPGKYLLTIKQVGKNGRILGKRMQNIEIKKGKKVFLNYRTLF